MIKTWTFVALGGVLGFLAMCWLVARRPPEPMRTDWFELPGTPVAVNDVSVADWQQANAVLRRLAVDRTYGMAAERPGDAQRAESDLGEFKITYRRRGGNLSGWAAPETVVVRAWQPITVDYGRAAPTQLMRFERVRAGPVE
jgi:hypothetical protein